jgi:hypothetical protein
MRTYNKLRDFIKEVKEDQVPRGTFEGTFCGYAVEWKVGEDTYRAHVEMAALGDWDLDGDLPCVVYIKDDEVDGLVATFSLRFKV